MMKCEWMRLAALVAVIIGASGCGDQPMQPLPSDNLGAELHGRSPSFSEDCASAGFCELEGITAVGGPSPTEDENPIVEPSCMMSTAYTCEEPAGGGAAGGGTTGPAPVPDDSAAVSSYEEGPLLWAACVLAVVGSTLSVADVASQFGDWWDAQRAAELAHKQWIASMAIPNAEPWVVELNRYKYTQALQRVDDARGAVSGAANTSVVALVGAGIACGATALVPSP